MGMRVMLDTNVLLSAVIFRSSVMEEVIAVASRGDNELVLCTYVIDEARDVVARKWPSRSRVLEDFFLRLSFDTVVTPIEPDSGRFEIRDPDDYPVLYSAVIGAVDVFVTGDKDFDDVRIEYPEIMTPAAFIESYRNT